MKMVQLRSYMERWQMQVTYSIIPPPFRYLQSTQVQVCCDVYMSHFLVLFLLTCHGIQIDLLQFVLGVSFSTHSAICAA